MLDIRPLTTEDLDAARALSTQAGWNQIAPDWNRFLTQCPEGCFAGTVDGDLVATTTVITYGDDVSWIGMVLVDEAYRSQGYGSQIFEHGLEYAKAAGGETVGLDATHLGEPIYRKYGFERVVPVSRWQGALRDPTTSDETGGTQSAVETPPAIERIRHDPLQDVESLCEFDHRQCETDRSGLLRTLVDESGVRVFRSFGQRGRNGYAVVRPGRTHSQIGPLVATDSAISGSLLRSIAIEFDGHDVLIDVPDRDTVTAGLERVGLERTRDLVRMTYPDPEHSLLTDSVYGFVDFAFG